MAKSGNHPMMPRWEAVTDDQPQSKLPLIVAGVLVLLTSVAVSVFALTQVRNEPSASSPTAQYHDTEMGARTNAPPTVTHFANGTDANTVARLTVTGLTTDIDSVGTAPQDVIPRGSYTAVDVTIENTSPERINIASHHIAAFTDQARKVPLAVTAMATDPSNDYGWQSPLLADQRRSFTLYFDIPDGDYALTVVYHPSGDNQPLVVDLN